MENEEIENEIAPEMETPETDGSPEQIMEEVNMTVAECLSKLESGEVTNKEELIDLLVEKLTALKDVESALGGLGMDEGMTLPEEEIEQ